MGIIEGQSCPNCNGHLETSNGTDYICPSCGTGFDVADLFYP
jgi:tRNA(Ile2) C34 agmatinyltransferase TiaS